MVANLASEIQMIRLFHYRGDGLSLPPDLIRRCDDLPAMITHVPVAAVLVLSAPDDGCLRPKHVE